MNKHNKRYSWQGGSSPSKEMRRRQEKYYRSLLAEQVRYFVKYWGYMPENDTIEIFKNRALCDSFEIMNRLERRVNPDLFNWYL